MSVSCVSFHGDTPKTEKKSRNVGASIAATIGGSVVQTASVPASLGVINLMSKIGNLSQDKIDILHSAAQKAIEETGLAAKGVHIEYLKPDNNGMSKILKMLLPIEQIKEGKNAAFVNKDAINKFTKEVIFKKNTILMPEKGISFASFHEIGHAMNYNFSKIGKVLQKMRMPAMAAAGLIALYAGFTRKSEAKEGQELSTGQKIKNFIRNNAGKLSFAAMIPILAEEAMATVKGQKLANKFLSPDMAKIVSKGNKTAYLSYLIAAAGLGLTSYATVKIKDHFVAKKEAAKNNA